MGANEANGANDAAFQVRGAAASLAEAKAAQDRAMSTLDAAAMMEASIGMQQAGQAINSGLETLLGIIADLEARLQGDEVQVLRTAPHDFTSWNGAFGEPNRPLAGVPEYMTAGSQHSV
jgi:hypothetical protein